MLRSASEDAGSRRGFQFPLWRLGSILVGALLIMLAIEWVGGWALSGMQLYMRADQRWTQRQQESMVHLARYADTGDEVAYERYRTAVEVPLSQRSVRIAIQDSIPGWDCVRLAVLADDGVRHRTAKAIMLGHYFDFVSGIGRALASWERGDVLLDSIRAQASAIRTEWSRPAPDRDRIEARMDRVRALDTRLGAVERNFSDAIYAWLSRLRRVIWRSQLGVALLVLSVGLVFAYRTHRSNRAWKRNLEESEKRWRTLVENHPTPFLVTVDRRIQYVNPSGVEMLGGRSAEEIVGRSVLDFVPPDTEETILNRWSQLNAGDATVPIQHRLIRADGEERIVMSQAVPITYEGKPAAQSVVRDLTERFQYEDQLREAKQEAERMNRMKSALLANTSHEIQTPLTSILGFADAIKEELRQGDSTAETSDTEPVKRFATLIEKSGRRLKSTLEAVLNLSKLEAGEMDLSPRPVDMRSVVEHATHVFRHDATLRGLELETEVPDQALWAEVDQDGVQIALDNLISNALKYTRDGGSVWVRVGKESGEVVVEVEDTGIGMKAERVSELFEPFRQESEGLTREYGGTGLGLAVTRQVVHEMEGRIDVTTEKGEGSCFRIYLPAADDTDSTPS